MAFSGKLVRLKGISQKGKNRVREHGDRWIAHREEDRVLFGPDLPGPWLLVSPEGTNQDDKASRWIRASGDPDFSMVVLGG